MLTLRWWTSLYCCQILFTILVTLLSAGSACEYWEHRLKCSHLQVAAVFKSGLANSQKTWSLLSNSVIITVSLAIGTPRQRHKDRRHQSLQRLSLLVSWKSCSDTTGTELASEVKGEKRREQNVRTSLSTNNVQGAQSVPKSEYLIGLLKRCLVAFPQRKPFSAFVQKL